MWILFNTFDDYHICLPFLQAQEFRFAHFDFLFSSSCTLYNCVTSYPGAAILQLCLFIEKLFKSVVPFFGTCYSSLFLVSQQNYQNFKKPGELWTFVTCLAWVFSSNVL